MRRSEAKWRRRRLAPYWINHGSLLGSKAVASISCPCYKAAGVTTRLADSQNWLSSHSSITISLVSILIAACSLIVAIRVQHIQYVNLKLNRQAAEKAGRLQSIVITRDIYRNEPAPSFKAINGADDITISSTMLQIRYSRMRPDKLRGNSNSAVICVPPASSV